MTPATFSAFCHISEYGEKGYAYLPQMVLLGRPLTLWAPSSRLILAHSGLAAADLLALVDRGHVRVIGREPWLMSRKYRDSHNFAGAAWTPGVDDTLRKWCEDDASKPTGAQRVATAPPEDGYKWADEYLENHPRGSKAWYDHYRRSPQTLPTGTLDTIARNLQGTRSMKEERRVVARTILRDGRNHGQAFQIAGSDISVHLDKVDLEFLRLLTDESSRPTIVRQSSGERTPSEAISAELTRQTLEILRWLRDAGRTRPMNLEDFLDHKVRQDLLDWMRTLCNEYKLHSPTTLDGVVLAHIRHDLADGTFDGAFVPPWRPGGLDTTAGLVGAVTSLLDAAVGDVSRAGFAGFGAMTFSATRTLLRALGYIPTRFDGPQWPFLFALDKPPTKRRRARLLTLLRDLPHR